MENEELIVTETEAVVEAAKTNGKDLLKGGLIGAGVMAAGYAVTRWIVKPVIKKIKAKKDAKKTADQELGDISEVTEDSEG